MSDFWWIVPIFFLSLFANAFEKDMHPKVAMYLSPLIILGKLWLPLLVLGVIIALFSGSSDPNNDLYG